MFPSCLLNKSVKIKKEEKKATSITAKRFCLPVKIRPSSATYDPHEIRSLHQQTFLKHDAWQTEL